MSAKPENVSWHERARMLEFRTQAFIDGRYTDAASGATFDSINPATGKVLRSLDKTIGSITITEVEETSAMGKFSGSGAPKTGDVVTSNK